jgi:hypothetical protein
MRVTLFVLLMPLTPNHMQDKNYPIAITGSEFVGKGKYKGAAHAIHYFLGSEHKVLAMGKVFDKMDLVEQISQSRCSFLKDAGMSRNVCPHFCDALHVSRDRETEMHASCYYRLIILDLRCDIACTG